MSIPIRNTPQRYGIIAILLHWTMAALLIGMFLLGNYMVDLDYYHPWYQKAPDLHRSLGVVVAALLLLRWLWRLLNPLPTAPGGPWERFAARQAQRLFYLLIAGAAISGYLISTADGRGVDLFGWFELPAILPAADNREDVAGQWHEWLTEALMLLALLHGLAALKHHFIERDDTLRRMLGVE